MFKREKVLVPATSGQVGEIAGALIGEMNFSKEEARAIIGDLGAFRRNVRGFYSVYRIIPAESSRLPSALISWGATYEKLFGKKPDFSAIRIPEKLEGLGPVRLIVVAREIMEWTNNRPLQGTQEALKKHFSCWQYVNDLDHEITTNDRDPKNGSYAVWVRDVREADEEFANKSEDDLVAEQHTGITVLERQLLEADYFLEKGEHMDRENVTLCSGSRYRGGNVPGARWSGGGFGVGWCRASLRFPHLRSRRVWA